MNKMKEVIMGKIFKTILDKLPYKYIKIIDLYNFKLLFFVKEKIYNPLYTYCQHRTIKHIKAKEEKSK